MPYGGLPLEHQILKWAKENGIKGIKRADLTERQHEVAWDLTCSGSLLAVFGGSRYPEAAYLLTPEGTALLEELDLGGRPTRDGKKPPRIALLERLGESKDGIRTDELDRGESGASVHLVEKGYADYSPLSPDNVGGVMLLVLTSAGREALEKHKAFVRDTSPAVLQAWEVIKEAFDSPPDERS